MSLTDKQEKFVQELIKGKSQREAYRIAYPKSLKWKDSAVDETASKLLKNPKVYPRYEELKNRLIKEAEDECIVSAKEVLKELKSIAFDDIGNYLSFKTVKAVVGYEDGEPIVDYKTVVDIKDSETIDTKNISEIAIGRDGQFKFKTYCRDHALIQLGKHLGLFKDKVEVTGEGGEPLNVVFNIPRPKKSDKE